MKPLTDFARRVTSRVDRLLGINSTTTMGNLYRAWLRGLSRVRRVTDPLFIRIGCMLGLIRVGEIKFNLGCGRVHLDGFINVDIWILDGTDVVHDLGHLPWPDNSAAMILSNHSIEHISYKVVPGIFLEWFRVLRPGGRLVIECPHFDEAVREYLAGDDDRLTNLFGQQRFPGDTHLYGYNPRRLQAMLEAAGFTNCREAEPRGAQRLDEPCFRMECEKP